MAAPAALLVAVVLAAYANSFGVPFLLDDTGSITDNPTLRAGFWAAWNPPPGGLTVSGRPLVNATLALNHVLGGKAVWGYHAFNLAVHVGAALALFGVVRRTLLRPALRERFGADAVPLALAAAGLWAVHPLQVESVTYLVQRAESLAGLWYLLTLYGFVRAVDEARPGRWLALSAGACLAGMVTKEVMVSAPLLVLLYDRTLVAGSFRAAWNARRRYYLALAATWVLLLGLVVAMGNRAGSAGFGAGVSAADYALTQCGAVAHYLRLAVWPAPLVFDYGDDLVRSLAEVWPQALLLAGLGAATVAAIMRRAPWGLAGAWFFAILAPSSSVVPVVSQTVAEHRMYLPLAAVILMLTVAWHRLAGRRGLWICTVLAVVLAGLTVRRNALLSDEVALWRETLALRPGNPRGHNNLGFALADRGDWAGALAQFEQALLLQPNRAENHSNLGHALLRVGRASEAVTVLTVGLRLKPDYGQAHHNLAEALMWVGRPEEAVAHYREALRLGFELPETHAGLGRALIRLGRQSEAAGPSQRALEMGFDDAGVHNDLGIALAYAGRADEALAQFERALQLDPAMTDARSNRGNMLFQRGDLPGAEAEYRRVLRENPAHSSAHNNLGEVLARTGRLREAAGEFETALRLDPNYKAARENLERLRARGGGP